MLLELRLVFRRLIQSSGFTSVSLLTLALGIGVNSSAFSVVNHLLFRSPYPAEERLVRVFRTSPQSRTWPHSVANFLDHRAQNTVFERVAAVNWASFNLGEAGQPAERMQGLRVTADFFPLLGVQPELGRWLTAGEDTPGQDAVVVLSYGVWQQRYGGDPAIIGRKIRVNSEPVTVIGVMPASFNYPQLWGRIDGWLPFAFSDEARQNRGNNYLQEIARLKPGVTLAQAQAELDTLAARLERDFPENNSQNGLRVIPLPGSSMDGFGAQLTWLVMGLGMFVLLIACANLANLQLARHASGARERAIRSALGASRWRLVRIILFESILLSIVGGALGLLVAAWCNDALGRRFNFGGFTGLALPLDGRALVFTVVASLLTGVAFGVLPAWLSSRSNVSDALKQGSRGSTASRAQHRLRHSLIVAEIALALVLLSGASFFLRGLDRILERNPGWEVDGLLTGRITLRGAGYETDDQRRAFHLQLTDRLSLLPGVEQAAFGSSLPTFGYSRSTNFVVEGRPEPAPGAAPLVSFANTTAGYFATLGLRLQAGRDFTADDLPGSPEVVIINESMARRFWPGDDPIGKRIGDPSPFMDNPLVVVGVVSDAGAPGNLAQLDTTLQMYRPLTQRPDGTLYVALRARHSPEALAADLRRVVAEIDPDQSVSNISTIAAELDDRMRSIRLAGQTLAGFALLGLFLAAIGIYGVISGFVVQRTSEIGIRLALGATLRDVLTLVLGQGLRLAFAGAGLGLAGSYGIARLLQAMAPGLPSPDLATALVVTTALLSIAAFACWLPAHRATRVDPLTALRAE